MYTNTFWHDPVIIGLSDDDEVIHRVTNAGFIHSRNTSILEAIDRPTTFFTACRRSYVGVAIHAIMNDVECSKCWDVPLYTEDGTRANDKAVFMQALGREEINKIRQKTLEEARKVVQERR